VDTPISSTLGTTASFQGLDALSSAGTTTKVTQKEHVIGEFTSNAVAGSNTKTRTSNYGTEYELNMQAIRGSLPSGILGYYVNPGMATANLGAIQGAVNASQSGDTINAAAGTYKENVQIDRSLTVKGAGAGDTIVDGQQAGSVFAIGKNDPKVDVALSGITLQNGSGTLIMLSNGYFVLKGGGILNYGVMKLRDSTISENTALYGGGIYNNGTVTWTEAT